MSITRRSLLGLGGAALASPLLGMKFEGQIENGKTPKNIIFMVADGMAIQSLTIADQFLDKVHGRRGYWHTLMNQEFATTGLQMTSSLSSVVTDSSAASSAWSSGRHIWNGQVNQFPDGTKLTPICEILHSAGMKTGLVTTTRITHATPAGFASCVFQRDQEDDIAAQYLKSGVDVLLGGGSRQFDATKRKDGVDLLSKFKAAGYDLVTDRAAMLKNKSKKVLGLFASNHLPYTVDHINSPEMMKDIPTLAELTRHGINTLKDAPKGFLLQVEGGRVDHAGHANDIGGMLHDQIAFEDAVKVAVEFALADGETLVVITTDHATGGLSLNGAGSEYFDSNAGLESLSGIKSSFEALVPQFGLKPTAKQVAELVESKLGYRLSGIEAVEIAETWAGRSPFKVSDFYNWKEGSLAVIMANHHKVGFTSGNHTSDHCLVTAVGSGSSWFAGVRWNISYFDYLLSLKGLKHSNPQMSFEDAKRAMDQAKDKGLYALCEHCCDPDE